MVSWMHPQNFLVGVADKAFNLATRMSQIRYLRHRAVDAAHAPDRHTLPIGTALPILSRHGVRVPLKPSCSQYSRRILYVCGILVILVNCQSIQTSVV